MQGVGLDLAIQRGEVFTQLVAEYDWVIQAFSLWDATPINMMIIIAIRNHIVSSTSDDHTSRVWPFRVVWPDTFPGYQFPPAVRIHTLSPGCIRN